MSKTWWNLTAILFLLMIAAFHAAVSTAAADPVTGFDIEAATAEYLSTMTAEEQAKSDAYFEGGYWIILWDLLITGLALSWLFLTTGIATRLRDFAERVTRFKTIHRMIFGALYTLLSAVIILPYLIYRDFYREHQYDLATQTFGPWLTELGLQVLVGAVQFAIILAVIYAVIAKWRRTWWIWGASASILMLVFLMLVQPVLVSPLFNDYKPLDDGPVRDAILSMARASGVPVDEVYQFDASAQTTRISANVSGFLGTARISLNDNLLNGTSPAEIKAVMGHEIGHYALGHAYFFLVSFAIILAVGFAFMQKGFAFVVGRWGRDWGLRGVADLAGYPVLAALLAVYFFALTPVLNTMIREAEISADIFGLHAAREPDGFAKVAMRLSAYRKISPGPIEEFMLFDHPSGRNRVHSAMRWKAEHLE